MTESIQKAAAALIEKGEVNTIIGYAEGSENGVRAHFARSAESTGEFILDERCVQNLAVYLVKGEVKRMGKVGIFATLPTVRSILQIASENQLTEDDLIVLGISDENLVVLGVTVDGAVQAWTTFKELEQFVAEQTLEISSSDKVLLEKLEGMSQPERWEFWQEQYSKCIKCYACRASCPMCYCGRCQTDFNQPQLITVEATPLGNLEWHTMRAMHLAGRCVACGDCGRACPVGIPIHLLCVKASMTVKEKFNADAGTNAQMVSALSTFEVDDKEDFIKYE